MTNFQKGQAMAGCLALTVWLVGVGISLTVVVLIIKALLKYIGS